MYDARFDEHVGHPHGCAICGLPANIYVIYAGEPTSVIFYRCRIHFHYNVFNILTEDEYLVFTLMGL